jgi:methionyl-tRNA formyltransferase
MAELICESLPKVDIVRIHVSGDFFNAAYFLAWCKAAARNPQILFYAYTKSLPIWIANRASVPSNLVLTASQGGLHDSLIAQHGLKTAQVVFSIEEANKLGLVIDHDDTHAMDANCQSFALLIHNVQPAGSEASKAMQALNGLGSYSDKQSINRKRAKAVDSQVAA